MPALLRSSAVLLSLVLAACVRVPAPVSVVPPAPPRVTIEVERLPSGDEWQVRYRLPQPVRQLVFLRHMYLFRADRWQVRTPGLRIERYDEQQDGRHGERERIVADDGRPFSEVLLVLHTDTSELEKEYNFFARFSDGALIMYTGHLAVGTPSDATGPGLRPVPARYLFRGRAGERIVLPGLLSTGREISWDDRTEDGAYVYFGRTQPIETPRLVALIDPGLPAWLRERTFALLPRLFDYYTDRLHVPLRIRPTIYFVFEPDGEEGTRGGSLEGLLTFALRGRRSGTQSAELLEHSLRFFAHEAAHLWNGQLSSPETGVNWMHEGGADAFAYRALLDFGVIDRGRYLEILDLAIARCTAALRSGPLAEAASRRDFRAEYDCGAAIALATGAAVHRLENRADLFSFWGTLLGAARGGTYTETGYLDLLQAQTGDAALAAQVRAFVHEPLADPARSLAELLQRAGIRVERTRSNLPMGVRKELGAAALRHLVQGDCQGSIDMTEEPEVARVRPLPRCRTIRSEVLASRIGPYRLWEEGDLVHEHVRERCQAEGAVQLAQPGNLQALRLPCRPPPDPGPALLIRAER